MPVSCVREVVHPQLEWVYPKRARDFIDVRLAREVIGGGSERAVRTDAHERVRAIDVHSHVFHSVGRLRAALRYISHGAGMNRLALPCRDFAVRSEGALDFDECGGAKGALRGVFLTGISDAYRTPRDASELRRLRASRIPALCSEPAADLHRDDAHVRLRHAKHSRQLRPQPERTL